MENYDNLKYFLPNRLNNLTLCASQYEIFRLFLDCFAN